MYVLIMLTGMFALRCSETCALQGEDFQLDHDPPQLRVSGKKGSSKSGKGLVPILKKHEKTLRVSL